MKLIERSVDLFERTMRLQKRIENFGEKEVDYGPLTTTIDGKNYGL